MNKNRILNIIIGLSIIIVTYFALMSIYNYFGRIVTLAICLVLVYVMLFIYDKLKKKKPDL